MRLTWSSQQYTVYCNINIFKNRIFACTNFKYSIHILQGCIYKMTEELENQLSILGAIGLGICGIQIFGMILSCCVYVKLKDVLDWQPTAAPILNELLEPLPDNISLIYYGHDTNNDTQRHTRLTRIAGINALSKNNNYDYSNDGNGFSPNDVNLWIVVDVHIWRISMFNYHLSFFFIVS